MFSCEYCEFQEHLFSRTTANDCFCNISLNGLRTPTNGRHFINLVSHYGISSLLSRIVDLLLKVPYRGTHISLEIFWVLVVYCCLFIRIDHFLQNCLMNFIQYSILYIQVVSNRRDNESDQHMNR